MATQVGVARGAHRESRRDVSASYEAPSASIGEHIGSLADGVSRLVVSHLKLARAELEHDLKTKLEGARLIAVFVAIAAVGYLLVTVAFSVFLSRFVPGDLAFALVAFAHLLVAGAGGLRAARLMKGPVLQETREELSSSKSALLVPQERSSRATKGDSEDEGYGCC